MRKQVLLFLCILFSSLLFSQSDDSLVIMANKAYSESDYHVAINLYEEIINRGKESPELYYNLGNAYYKVNQIPGAILYYEKARKLKPNDKKINFNLAIANRKVLDKIDTMPELFIWTWWRAFYNLFTEKTWAIASICSFALVFLMFTIYLFSKTVILRKISFWLAMLMLLITLVSFLNAWVQYSVISREKEAVIFTPSVTVKSSPDLKSIDLFVLHEGTKVKILDMINEWYEIEIADGSEGWLEAHHMKKI